MCLFQKWSLKVFQKSRTLPGKVNIKLPGVKKNRNKMASFCLARGNQKRAAWDVLSAESIAVGLLASRARAIICQGPANGI